MPRADRTARRAGISAAIGAAAALAYAAPARRLPALEDYTAGASAVAREVTALFASPGASPGIRESANRELVAFARDWLARASDERRVESQIVDFPRRPGRRALLELRVRLEGLAPGPDPRERLYADALFDLDLERRSRGSRSWTLTGSRPAPAKPGERPAPPVIRTGVPRLREVAAEIGLGDARHEALDPVEATNLCLPATHHHPGVLLADFDGDGSVDVLLPSRRPRLFLNDGHGRFRDATAGSGLDRLPEGEAAGGVAADLDGDGLPELFLTYAYTACRLLHNDGGGRFHDVTAEAGLAGLAGTYTSAVFFDADGDGRLDLFVADYGDARRTGPAFSGKNGPGSRFFHNVEKEGRPFFVDATAAAGIADTGWAFAASACDSDGDGRDDLYVANDFGTNVLYHNVSAPGSPRFEERAKAAGVLDDGYGMGVTWGDYDNDGRFDLAVSDFSSPFRWLIRSPRLPMPPQVPRFLQAIARPIVVPMLLRRCQGDGLYRNRGDGTFEKTSGPAGVREGGWAWGTEFVDLDGDGREDLLVVNGMWQAAPGGKNDEVGFWNAMAAEGIEFHDGRWGGIDFGENGMASRTEKHLYRNLGDGAFEEQAYLSGFDTRADTRGLAFGDLDGDGAPEIVVATFRGPLLVYRNEWKEAHRLTLDLRALSPHNRQAIGAVVRLRAAGRIQLREVRAGSSYLSQSATELYFGLGEASGADEIEVRWPDGTREVRREVPAGRLVWEQADSRPPARSAAAPPEEAHAARPRSLPPSSRARSFDVAFPGGRARIFVPKTFEPLLPGSVYPNRKKPVAARMRPLAVVEGSARFAKRLREPLLERGFVVAEARAVSAGGLAGLLAALADHPEADPSRAILICSVNPVPEAGTRFAAVEVFDPAPGGSDSRGPAGATAVFVRTPFHTPGAAATRSFRERFGSGVVEKWYRSRKDFPDQAFRDAAEWGASRAAGIR